MNKKVIPDEMILHKTKISKVNTFFYNPEE